MTVAIKCIEREILRAERDIRDAKLEIENTEINLQALRDQLATAERLANALRGVLGREMSLWSIHAEDKMT